MTVGHRRFARVKRRRASPFGSAKPLAVLGRPGGYGEGSNTRSHPELGRENPQRRWYCVLRRGRVGRRQVFQARKKNSARENSQERHKTTPEIPIPSLRSEEHTSELQSLMSISSADFCLKQKTKQNKEKKTEQTRYKIQNVTAHH